MIELIVPMLPPSVNGYWKMRRGGGRYITAEGVAFKKLVYAHKCAQRVDLTPDDMLKPLKLEIEYSSPRWYTKYGSVMRTDVDNLCKCSLDALSEALSFDDSLIFELKLTKVVADIKQTRFRLLTWQDKL